MIVLVVVFGVVSRFEKVILKDTPTIISWLGEPKSIVLVQLVIVTKILVVMKFFDFSFI